MNLFFIHSPLQLLNAIEAREKLSSKKNDLLIISYSGEKKNDDQIDKLLHYYKWDNIEKLPVYISMKERIFRYILFTFKLLRQKNIIKIAFIGEYRSDYIWMVINNLDIKEIYTIDDGNATLNLLNIFKNIDQFNKTRLKSKDYIFNIVGLNNSHRSITNLFTIYEFPNLKKYKIVRNNFEYLQKKMEKLTIDKNTIFFIGTWMTEPGFMDEKYFYESLGKIFNYYEGQNIIYIPHRREDVKKISMLFPNIQINRFKNIVELEFLFKKVRPFHIASFYSTALYTLNKIYNVEKVDSFLFDLNKIDKKYYDNVKKSYDYYREIFNVIDLERM